MIFDHTNTRYADVVDVESRHVFKRVLSVNTEIGELLLTSDPICIGSDGESIETEKVRFRSIYPIYGTDKQRPELFHCYGRLHQ